MIPLFIIGQVPQGFNYQAILRNSAGQEITNQTVGIQISLLQYAADGSAMYVERYTTTTNDFGLINLVIGTGDIQSGSFAAIDWEDGPYFLKVEVDEAGGTTYTELGISQLFSVPYANHANSADTITGTINETDPNVPQGSQIGDMQYWDGTEWIIVAAGNEGQFLSFSNGEPVWLTLVGAKTAGPTDVYNPSTGEVWMDRNLGASQVATSSTDAAAYGDLYQWGRTTDGHEKRTSGTTTTLSGSDTPGHDDFILAPDSPYDWRNPQNDNLWQGVSGTNNPCPSGYRLPTEAEWEAERTSWNSNYAAGAFASPLKLPLAGGRSYFTGSVNSVGWVGYYWSSTAARALYFWSELADGAGFVSRSRAEAYSVRCLKH